jgi:hypothetical protein
MLQNQNLKLHGLRPAHRGKNLLVKRPKSQEETPHHLTGAIRERRREPSRLEVFMLINFDLRSSNFRTLLNAFPVVPNVLAFLDDVPIVVCDLPAIFFSRVWKGS